MDEYEEDISWIRPNLSQSGFTDHYPLQTNCVICLCPMNEMYMLQVGHTKSTGEHDPHKNFRDLDAYLWLPIQDHPNQVPTVHWLDLVTHIVGSWLQAGRCVHVQCYAGLSRSTLVTSAYLMRYEHLTAKEAMTEIRRLRAYAQPNSGFVGLLEQYDQHLLHREQQPSAVEVSCVAIY
jgi:protein-tyrosine phosphatase